MSKAVRKQLLGAMEELQRANQMVGKNVGGTQQEQVYELLVECQECAIAIGNQIEQLYGEGTQSVSGLERYCEMIYQMTQHLENIITCKELYALAENMLKKIRVDMENDIPNRTEAVFLPYKASMWDSLESVWKAADKDLDCDAYVIPIPYYDKDPDGSFREEHYEGELYPKNVPITRFDNYDFGMRRPDIIFIHNPYDDANFVTSVHPFFYAKNLKKFTDRLVYIPYFILDEAMTKDRDAIKPFCITSGVIHASKVVVQSQDMRQIYIEIMTEAAGENTRRYWEQKILGVGSPKLDKLFATKKEDLEISNEWLERIEKADGSWKNIVFYNTGVTALLKYDEQILAKMQDVFRVFREQKDNVTLLWRPHPLIKATLETMRPQLLVKYENIVEQYKAEGWGIYDDSADMNRAVALSDAYYGDGSSIVELFLKAGKDVMLQNPYLIYEKPIKDCLWSLDFAIDGACIWFVPFWYNLLCCYNVRDGKIETMMELPEANHLWALYNKIVKVDSRIILIPNNATKLCIYDTAIQNWKTFEIEESKGQQDLFCAYGIWNEVLYLFPQSYPYIVKLDLSTYKLEHMKMREGKGVQKESCTVASKIYFLPRHTNHVLIYDMDDHSIIEKEVGDSKDEYFTICNVKPNQFYLSNQNGDIIVWDEVSGEITKHNNSIEDFAVDNGKVSYYGVLNNSVFDEKYVYFVPGAANKALKIDRETNEIEEMYLDNNLHNVKKELYANIPMYSKVKFRDGQMYGFDMGDKKFFYIDCEKQQRYEYTIEMDDTWKDKADEWYDVHGKYTNICRGEYGTYYLHLYQMLRKITRENISMENMLKEEVGQAIYERCK